MVGSSTWGGPGRIYRNESGNLIDTGATLPDLTNAGASWGDYDNDGDLDLLICGSDSNYIKRAAIYKNNGGVFTDSGLAMTGISGFASFSDYDRDGRTEFLLAGYNTANLKAFRIYRYQGSTLNTSPAPPSNLQASQVGDGVVFSFDPALDTQTPAAGLSYNLRIGTSPGASDLYCSMSDPASGVRRLPASGGSRGCRTWKVKGLPGGMVYWSVQAVDGAYAGGGWASERSLTVVMQKISGRIKDANGSGVAGVSVSAGSSGPVASTDSTGYYELWVSPGWSGMLTPSMNQSYFSPGSRSCTNVESDLPGQDFSQGSVGWTWLQNVDTAGNSDSAWGDYDGDGLLDLLQCGRSSYGQAPVTALFHQNADGAFTKVQAGFVGVHTGAVAWGDYDGDGDLDVAIAGDAAADSNITPTLMIYRNDGGKFTDSGALLPGMTRGDLAWGDCDNDGDLDLAVCGVVGDDIATKVFINDFGAFVDSKMDLPPADYSKLSWADFDRDGDLDLVVVGRYGIASVAALCRNTGGVLADSGISLATYSAPTSVAWGDFDCDGFPDLAIQDGNYLSIRRNTENGEFIEVFQMFLPSGDLAWVDYDNDGDLDLAAMGIMGGSWVTRFIRNDGSTFTFSGLQTYGAQYSTLAAGDYDSDGDVDIYVSGTGVIKNTGARANMPPTAPSRLIVSFEEGCAVFSWAVSSDAETPSGGLTYNLRVGTSPGSGNIISAMSGPTGIRRTPSTGNVQGNLTWKVKDLPVGTAIYWSVQAVDSGFAGSAWAGEQSSTADFNPPAIVFFSPSPSRVAPHEKVRLYAEVGDDVGVDSVVVDGVRLDHPYGNIWTGSIEASAELGVHPLDCTAQDISGKTSSATSQYTTQQVLGIVTRDLGLPVVRAAQNSYLFKIWGIVGTTDSSGFTLDEKSEFPVRVAISGNFKVSEGDIVAARGELDTSTVPPTLICTPENVGSVKF